MRSTSATYRVFSATFGALLGAASLLLCTAPALAAPAPGSLIKLPCPNGALPDNPCKAVYFYGSDDKRHAFPNEKVYFGWYKDFSAVQTVDANFMASLPLGQNVTYHPGTKLVKFLTDARVFAVGLGGTLHWVTSEQAASTLYGSDWNQRVDDIPDTFFTDYRFAAQIDAAADFSPAAETAATPSVDDDLPATHRKVTVKTAGGSFSVDVIKLHKDRFRLVTATGNTSDCATGCVARPLLDYANDIGAKIGMHGSYFCPPDYSDCVSKTNSFLWPVFNTAAHVMINNQSLQWHHGPMLTQTADGTYRYFHRASEFGTSVAAFEANRGSSLNGAIANYPSLIENGVIVVNSEEMLDDGQRTIKATRGGIGYDDRFVNLVIARGATVPDLADVFKALGATNAMNLDGGGSVAMLFDGQYKVGPGRQLPNAILFLPR